jgi:hypothetical protein
METLIYQVDLGCVPWVELTLIEETVHFLPVCRKLAKPVNDLNLKLLWTRVRLPPSPLFLSKIDYLYYEINI